MEMSFIDTHCHLNFEAFKEDWREVLDKAMEARVEKIIVVGASLESSIRAVELAQEHPALYASVGIHPHHVREFSVSNDQFSINFQLFNEQMSKLKELAKRPRVVAIGETGLDYHVPKVSKYPAELLPITEELKSLQRNLFREQIKLAQEMNLPMILHSREAKEEVLEILKQVQDDDKIQGTFHCFGGSKKYLKRILAAGFYVGFDGDITYVPDRAGVAGNVPLDRLLLETDSPLLTPFPHRGERNEPINVKLIAQKQAKIRNMTLEDIEEQTTNNAESLFKFEAGGT
jgi:TatD DNase family protein